jgi:hypothetical protein
VSCDPNDPNKLLYCDQTRLNIPFRHDFKLAGNDRLPYGLEASGTLISFAGNQNASTNNQAGLPTGGSADQSLNVFWMVRAGVFPNAQRTPSVTVPLIESGTKYLKRRNQLDLEGKPIVAWAGRPSSGRSTSIVS